MFVVTDDIWLKTGVGIGVEANVGDMCETVDDEREKDVDETFDARL